MSPPLYNPFLVEILKGKSRFIENKLVEKLFHAICMTFIWHVWNWRNKILHASLDHEANVICHDDIFPSVQRLSFYWLTIASNRLFLCKNWIQNPDELAHHRFPSYLVLGVFFFGFDFRCSISEHVIFC